MIIAAAVLFLVAALLWYLLSGPGEPPSPPQ
jgi:hypothetical protein